MVLRDVKGVSCSQAFILKSSRNKKLELPLLKKFRQLGGVKEAWSRFPMASPSELVEIGLGKV